MNNPGSTTARRRATSSPWRRLSRNVLVIGSVVALVAAFGPAWAARGGVVVAVAAAAVACAAAWRELSEARREHAREMLAASKAHGSALSAERRQGAAVVEVLAGRVELAETTAERAEADSVAAAAEVVRATAESMRAGAEARRQRGTIAELQLSIDGHLRTCRALRAEVSDLRGDRDAARQELRERETVVASLQQALAARENELHARAEGGQVRAIPRRAMSERIERLVRGEQAERGERPVRGEQAERGERPVRSEQTERADEATELWGDAGRPGVDELVESSVALPNYEGERKRA